MSRKQRILLYLYSTPNIVGAILGILGLLLYFIGLIGSYWFLIVVGLYGIGVLATPKRSAVELKLRNELSLEEIRNELRGLVLKIKNRVPNEIYTKVISITNSILEILPKIVDLNSSDYNIYTIRQTALEYLPETLENYLKLPAAYAGLHPLKDGKAAKQLLIEQLDILDKEMKDIVQDFYNNDTNRLVAHGRFLEEKFKGSAAW
jgi:hypothetical protein